MLHHIGLKLLKDIQIVKMLQSFTISSEVIIDGILPTKEGELL